ncbi:uncharacterized protein ARMOST_16126 [Armillaria ostoyae]|uniref:Peptidase C14 caspase domain-containing protein n=1 Tax=Armillaria ostoyae TaxID=47428 RepID=A0A284RVE9_ARMOS|nr:uncharacterized protein ARMOST_16126 [Armillaria ostoyae]
MSRNKPRSPLPRHRSRNVAASIRMAEIFKAIGEMVPVAGSFIKGIAETAKLLLEDMEQFKTNKEDIEALASEIIDIVKVIRDAGIQVSALPEGMKYAAGLQTACLEFQELFLSDLSMQLNEMKRNKGGIRGRVVDFLASRDVKEGIKRQRELVDKARDSFSMQLLLSLFQVAVNSDTTISRMNEEISLLRSTILTSAPPTVGAINNVGAGETVQMTRRYYRMPGGIDLVEGFQKMDVRVRSSRDASATSVPALAEWLYKLQLRFIFFWWYIRFQWSFSLRFEISPTMISHRGRQTWAVIIGIDAYPFSPLRGCVSDALAMGRYLVDDLHVPADHIQYLLGTNFQHRAAPNNFSISFGFDSVVKFPHEGVSKPTCANIIQALLILSTNPDIRHGDNIIIYFAGHGTAYRRADYFPEGTLDALGHSNALCPIDRGLQHTASDTPVPDISDFEINVILTEISRKKGHHITIILDCAYSSSITRGYGIDLETCSKVSPRSSSIPGSHSASMTKDSLSRNGVRCIAPLPSSSFLDVFRAAEETFKHFVGYQLDTSTRFRSNMDSHVVLAACQNYELAEEGEQDSGFNGFNGIFTGALISAFKSVDLNDKSISYYKLIESLSRTDTQHPVIAGRHMKSRLWFQVWTYILYMYES